MSSSERRARRRQSRAAKRGQAPGSAIYTGSVVDSPVDVRVIDFNADDVHTFDSFTEPVRERAFLPGTVTWIDLHGIHDPERVNALGAAFGLHPLWIEDILNPSARAKSEVLDDKLLVLAKMARVVRTKNGIEIDTEQVALVCGPGFVLTFQEQAGDVWDGVRGRIEHGAKVRRMGPSYLLHGLLDAIVDEYFAVLEHFEVEVDGVEERSLAARSGDLPPRLFGLRSELTSFRGLVWPLREAVGQLVRGDFEGLSAEAQPFYRDLYDHLVQTMDILDNTRERLLGVIELQLAVTSYQMNEVMRLLTLVSTVFIPITFVAGVYGMNFDHMPELHAPYGYPAVWGLMIAIAALMLAGFRWRNWL